MLGYFAMGRNRTAYRQKRDGSDFRYIELANDLRKQLEEGKFKFGDRFYSLRGLMRKTDRSLPTVRSAMNILLDEGLIESKHGSGYYVTAKVERLRGEGAFKVTVTLPSFATPSRPWFTGKVLSGIMHAAEQNNGVISVLQRSDPPYDDRVADCEFEKIMSIEPDAIAWLHATSQDKPLLERFSATGLPLLTTMRAFHDLGIPFLREDDLLYASIVLTSLRTLGHRRLGIIAGNPGDNYYKSKIDALQDVGRSLDIEIREQDVFCFQARDKADYRFHATRLREYVSERKNISAILVLKSDAIHPLKILLQSSFRKAMSNISLIYNVLDGVTMPDMPAGETLATISPPFAEMGELIFTALKNMVDNVPDNGNLRIIPTFKAGSTLKRPAS